MKNILGSLALITVFLFAVSAIAADKVVVVPLGGSSPGPHYYTLPGAVFVGNTSAGHNATGQIAVSAGSTYYAPVILPNQAKLTEFVVWAKNGSTSVPDDASLVRFDRQASSPTTMATATVPCWGSYYPCSGDGTFQELVAPSIAPDVIDNIDYSYAVVIHSGDGLLQVSAVRITYTTK